MDSLDMSVEFSRVLEELLAILALVFFRNGFLRFKVKFGVVLGSLHRRESFPANRTLLTLRVAFLDVVRNLIHFRHNFRAKLAKTLFVAVLNLK